MGHYQIVTCDPTRTERKFYLLVVGGSDDYQRYENEQTFHYLKEENFCNLEDLLLYAYGSHEAPIYVDLVDIKRNITFDDFDKFIDFCTK